MFFITGVQFLVYNHSVPQSTVNVTCLFLNTTAHIHEECSKATKEYSGIEDIQSKYSPLNIAYCNNEQKCFYQNFFLFVCFF